MNVVSIAEPRDFHREMMIRRHSVDRSLAFKDWRQAVAAVEDRRRRRLGLGPDAEARRKSVAAGDGFAAPGSSGSLAPSSPLAKSVLKSVLDDRPSAQAGSVPMSSGDSPDDAGPAGVASSSTSAKTAGAGAVSDVGDFGDYQQSDRLAEAVIIATQDAEHVGPALELARQGYHMLLEKPMAPTPEECLRICKAVQRSGKIFACGHVLRYTPYMSLIKRLIDSGSIGDVVNV